jgi:hypothetical protein
MSEELKTKNEKEEMGWAKGDAQSKAGWRAIQ